MADVASRQHATNHLTFLCNFTSTFPPPQGYCWHKLQLHKRRTWKVFSLLLKKLSTMELWRQLSRKGGRTGSIGKLGCPSTNPALIPTSTATAQANNESVDPNKWQSWRPTAAMYDLKAISEAPTRFVPRQSPWRYKVSPQSVNWLQNLTSWEARKTSIQNRFDKSLRVSKEKTHRANQG